MFVKGVSGNPTGRPKLNQEVRDMARAHTPKAIAALARVISGKKSPAAAVVAAAIALLDRGWGKPMQPIEGTIDILDRLSHGDRLVIEAALVALAGSQGDAAPGSETAQH